jgi:hypothetical protein
VLKEEHQFSSDGRWKILPEEEEEVLLVTLACLALHIPIIFPD